MGGGQLIRQRSAGFTLIEVLVVVFIIGVIVGMATLSFSGRSLDDSAETEARRLLQIFRLASEEASLTGLELGWLATKDGYRFLALSDQGWTLYTENGPLRPRKLPEPLTLRVEVDDLPLPDDAERVAPQLLFLSSGELLPFTLDLSAPQLDIGYRIRGRLMGQLELSRMDKNELRP